MNLAEYRNKQARLADFLPWVALVGAGIVLNKDGSFQRTARFRGPDLDSAVPAELVAVAGRLNNAFRRLGSGWAIFVEAQRHAAATYPNSTFPDSASALVDAERKGPDARIKVKFTSQQVNVTQDSEGRIVDGHPNEVATITDIWTFSRDISTAKARSNPNWRLVATQAPN